MAWIERIDKRTRRGKTWQDNVNPRKFSADFTLAAVHHESVIDSGVYDAPIDCTPVRVNNPQFDGWRITENGWHYALGKDLANHGNPDGWVGFGGRQGQHFFKFRLLRVGYLHWPTRSWDDVGGAPNYDRANLSMEARSISFPTDESQQPVENVANWSGLWSTPNGGDISVSWRVNGDGLKEEITLNQQGREWLASNRPPGTPANETYFGFVFKLDWSDIPKIYRQGILQDTDGDFEDANQEIQLKDAQDRLLAFMPVDDIRVPGSIELGIEDAYLQLRKRFWLDGDGNHYLLVGARVDQLNVLPAGDLIFDPTIDAQVGVGANDAVIWTTSGWSNAWERATLGRATGGYVDFDSAHRFSGISGLSGVTIDVSYTNLYGDSETGTSVLTNILAEDAAAPTATTSRSDFLGRTRTTASVAWDFDPTTDWDAAGWNQSPSINSIIQELADSYDPSAIQLFHPDDGSADNNYVDFWQYDGNSARAPKLHIEYTAGGAATILPQMIQHYYGSNG